MESESEFYFSKGELKRSAMLHPMCFNPFRFHPATDFVIANDGWIAALCNFDGVAYMVAMAVRNKNEVRF